MAYAYPIVLKDDRVAGFTVVVPQFTWQAYNGFGGSGFYVRDPTGAGVLGHFVSFARPYLRCGGADHIYCNSPADINAARWLERSGYDVNYVSDLDLTNAGLHPAPPKHGLIFMGHDEYWTWDEFDYVESLRDRGLNLAFLSANNAYWDTRLSTGNVVGQLGTVLICFKGDRDSAGVAHPTQTFRALGRPENALYGIMYTATSAGAEPLRVPLDVSGAEARQFLAAAGLEPGDSVTSVVGAEGDAVFANPPGPPNLQLLFHSSYIPNPGSPPGEYDTAFFIAPSGAGIFASGTIIWPNVLDSYLAQPERPQVQAVTKAVLDWMIAH
jgi:hypothetical protein